MAEITFEEIGNEEKKLLLKAFDYDVDDKGHIFTPSGSQVFSKESPDKALTLDNIALTPGSLKVIDGTPTSISKFIRESIETRS